VNNVYHIAWQGVELAHGVNALFLEVCGSNEVLDNWVTEVMLQERTFWQKNSVVVRIG